MSPIAKPVKKTHPRGTNLANKLNAIMVYMAALADLIAAEQPIPGDGTGGGTVATQRALDSATEEQNRLIGDMLEEIARRVFALFKARPGPDDLDQIDRVFEILRLEGWNSDALDWVYDLACDGIAIEGYAHAEIFGDAKPEPTPTDPDCIACDGEGTVASVDCNVGRVACEACGGTGTNDGGAPDLPAKPMTREERDAKADKLAAICEANGFEHATSCYEESDGVRPHGSTFWVCKPGCATLRAHAILREQEGSAAK